MATLIDIVKHFNAPNNPARSSYFKYGVGGSPAGFVQYTAPTLNPFGTPTYSFANGGSDPNASYTVWNGTPSTILYPSPFNTIHLPPTLAALDPQATAGAMIRFTAPVASSCVVSGLFQGIDTSQHSASVYVYSNGVLQASGTVSAFGGQVPFSFTDSLTPGQTIDFIVISAGGFQFLSTGVQGTIVFDAGNGNIGGTGCAYFAH